MQIDILIAILDRVCDRDAGCLRRATLRAFVEKADSRSTTQPNERENVDVWIDFAWDTWSREQRFAYLSTRSITVAR